MSVVFYCKQSPIATMKLLNKDHMDSKRKQQVEFLESADESARQRAFFLDSLLLTDRAILIEDDLPFESLIPF